MRGGTHGNACAIGSLPLWLAKSERDNPPSQLLGVGSLLGLEQLYGGAGLDVAAASDERALQAPWKAHTTNWLDHASSVIAQAVNCAACLLDLDVT